MRKNCVTLRIQKILRKDAKEQRIQVVYSFIHQTLNRLLFIILFLSLFNFLSNFFADNYYQCEIHEWT